MSDGCVVQMNLNALGTREIKVRAGERLKIDVPIVGSPTPTVVWKKNGKEVPVSSRVRTGEKYGKEVPVSSRVRTGKKYGKEVPVSSRVRTVDDGTL